MHLFYRSGKPLRSQAITMNFGMGERYQLLRSGAGISCVTSFVQSVSKGTPCRAQAGSTIEQQRVAVLVHSPAAVAAIIVWIIHVYAAIWIRGSMQAMTRGYVTPGWAWRHHRRWLRRQATTSWTTHF
jgi:hypothetical protein